MKAFALAIIQGMLIPFFLIGWLLSVFYGLKIWEYNKNNDNVKKTEEKVDIVSDDYQFGSKKVKIKPIKGGLIVKNGGQFCVKVLL